MFLDVVVDTDKSILQFHRMLSVFKTYLFDPLSPRERAGVKGLFPRAVDTLTLTLSQREREPNLCCLIHVYIRHYRR